MLLFVTYTTSLALFTGAVHGAYRARAGPGGYLLAIIIGLLLASCNVWGLFKVVGFLAERTKSYSETLQNLFGLVFLLLFLLWVLVAISIGGWVTSAVLRLVA